MFPAGAWTPACSSSHGSNELPVYNLGQISIRQVVDENRRVLVLPFQLIHEIKEFAVKVKGILSVFN